MRTVADDLVTWLRAQLDDDERVAQAVEGIRQPWYFEMIDDAARPLVELALDPARVLAEVDAKRRILDEAEGYSPELEHGDNGEWAFNAVLRMLALPYADRAGYREDWRP